MSNPAEETILACPRCLSVKIWLRALEAAPGPCLRCHTRRPWNVLKERPKRGEGHVIVYSHEGSQQLKGPSYREDPNGWRK
jgi:hypothetical protein